ncbi:MAG: hypothetical protein H7Z71_02000 [Moraxellaceae bacterium]|nr:hypothetical protein [Pseudobdellovibrionaceae bacterium]
MPIAFLLFILGLNSQANTLACASLFTQETHADPGYALDPSYGMAHQKDFRLKQAGLFAAGGFLSADKSMLCGPTCLVNVIEKFKVQTSQINFPTNDVQKIIDHVQNPNPILNLSTKSIVKFGVDSKYLALNLKSAAQEAGLNLDVQVKTAVSGRPTDFEKGISLNELKASIQPDQSVIVLFGLYRAHNLQQVEPSNRVGGHFMIVAGYDRLSPNQMIFQDPERPLNYRQVNLISVKPKNFSAATFEVQREQQFFSPTKILIEDIIIIKNEKK